MQYSCASTLAPFSVRILGGEMGEAGDSQVTAAEVSETLTPRLWAQANHDLRQPLQALFFMTRSLARSLQDQQQRETVQYMEAALQGLQTKLNMLTDLSRIVSGTRLPTLRPCSILEICRAMSDNISALATSRGIRLRFRVSPILVISDEALLGLLIKSLILNGLKLANRGDLLIGSRRRGNRVRLECISRGPLSTRVSNGLRSLSCRAISRLHRR